MADFTDFIIELILLVRIVLILWLAERSIFGETVGTRLEVVVDDVLTRMLLALASTMGCWNLAPTGKNKRM